MSYQKFFALAVIVPALLAGCSQAPKTLDMANPASVHCLEQGGTLKLEKDAEGNEAGYCYFEDGSVCEEWAFFRGECRPGIVKP